MITMVSSPTSRIFKELTEVLNHVTANEELLLFHLNRLRIERQAFGRPVPGLFGENPPASAAPPRVRALVQQPSTQRGAIPTGSAVDAHSADLEFSWDGQSGGNPLADPVRAAPHVTVPGPPQPPVAPEPEAQLPVPPVPAVSQGAVLAWPETSVAVQPGVPINRDYDYFSDLDRRLAQLSEPGPADDAPD